MLVKWLYRGGWYRRKRSQPYIIHIMQIHTVQHPTTFSIAPMMDYTNKHQRTLMRLITKQATLYTEMVVCNTLLYRENRIRSLQADFSVEDPLVMQLGGSDPMAMRDATKIAMEYGYKDFNINVGCPSEKVSGAGAFGAVLMKSPGLVCDIALAIADVLGRAPTIKCRIGVDDMNSYENLAQFVEITSKKGEVSRFIIHARTAILGGKLNPKQNRTIPPLKYSFVYKLARDFPHLNITLNGGVMTLGEAEDHLSADNCLKGVMVGRSIINSPFEWRNIDSRLYKQEDLGFNRREILMRYAAYAKTVELEEGSKARFSLLKPLHHLFTGSKNGKKFRQFLGDNAKASSNTGIDDVILRATDSIGCANVLDYY